MARGYVPPPQPKPKEQAYSVVVSDVPLESGEKISVYFPPQGASRGWDAHGRVIHRYCHRILRARALADDPAQVTVTEAEHRKDEAWRAEAYSSPSRRTSFCASRPTLNALKSRPTEMPRPPSRVACAAALISSVSRGWRRPASAPISI